VLSVINKEFVEAAIAQGASNLRLIFSEILPNVVSTVIVFLPLMIATNIILEASLSFLSIGVQPPNVSWGTIISDGEDLLYSRPWVSMSAGIMIVLTVLALNVLGDGVRDALDPRAKIRGEGECWPAVAPDAARTAPAPGDDAHADVHRPPVPVDRAGPIRDLSAGLLHLLQDPGRGSSPRDRRPERQPADPGRDPGPVRARPAAPGPVRADDEEPVHHPQPGLVLEPGRARGPRDRRRRARHLVAGVRRRGDLGHYGDRHGRGRGEVPGQIARPAADDPGAD